MITVHKNLTTHYVEINKKNFVLIPDQTLDMHVKNLLDIHAKNPSKVLKTGHIDLSGRTIFGVIIQ